MDADQSKESDMADPETISGSKYALKQCLRRPKVSRIVEGKSERAMFPGRQERMIRLILAAIRVWELKNRVRD